MPSPGPGTRSAFGPWWPDPERAEWFPGGDLSRLSRRDAVPGVKVSVASGGGGGVGGVGSFCLSLLGGCVWTGIRSGREETGLILSQVIWWSRPRFLHAGVRSGQGVFMGSLCSVPRASVDGLHRGNASSVSTPDFLGCERVSFLLSYKGSSKVA